MPLVKIKILNYLQLRCEIPYVIQRKSILLLTVVLPSTTSSIEYLTNQFLGNFVVGHVTAVYLENVRTFSFLPGGLDTLQGNLNL